MDAAQGNAAGAAAVEGAVAPAGREVQQSGSVVPVSAAENLQSVFIEPMAPDEIAAALAATQPEL